MHQASIVHICDHHSSSRSPSRSFALALALLDTGCSRLYIRVSGLDLGTPGASVRLWLLQCLRNLLHRKVCQTKESASQEETRACWTTLVVPDGVRRNEEEAVLGQHNRADREKHPADSSHLRSR